MNQVEESMYRRGGSRRVPGGERAGDLLGAIHPDDRSGGHDGGPHLGEREQRFRRRSHIAAQPVTT
jgi:hypothetical protein